MSEKLPEGRGNVRDNFRGPGVSHLATSVQTIFEKFGIGDF